MPPEELLRELLKPALRLNGRAETHAESGHAVGRYGNVVISVHASPCARCMSQTEQPREGW